MKDFSYLLISIILANVLFIVSLGWFLHRTYIRKLRKSYNNVLKEQFKANMIFEHQERVRLSKEIHDGLCSDLMTMKTLVSIVEVSNDIDLKEELISELIPSINECYNEALRISYNLSPPEFDKSDLNTILRSYVLRISKTTDIEVSIETKGTCFAISNFKKYEVYRVMQELIQNILKHSHATSTTITIVWLEKELNLIISDDGIQYDLNEQKTLGLGIENIRSRVDLIDAHFHHQSSQVGNVVTLKISKDD